MTIASSAWASCRSRRGSALIIVLLFVILLTALIIAFLSRSMTALRVSSSSAGETKASILANSASDIILGDLRQEIIAGSTQGNPTAPTWPVFNPKSNLTMIPYQNGIPSPNTTIPNLIRRSVSPSNTGGTAPYNTYTSTLYTAASIPPARAATDATATGETAANYATVKVNSAAPSLNGRSVSAAKWNEPLLMSGTQLSSFIPPDWIIVTRAGAKSVGWSSGGTTGLNVATPTNSNYAVGRFAYAVYNEGGLLDMNVAGYPSNLSPALASNKSSLALADLTQIGLTQAQIDNIVGWRNYATAELSGTYGNFNPFTATAAGNWLTNFVLGNTNGYMQTTPAPSGVTTPPTDQAFVSRQQLIQLAQSLGINNNSLQYMGTFSRGLEQPSFSPDPNRPKVINSSIPPVSTNVNAYLGNNDAVNTDTSIASSSINPAFLGARVKTAFTRFNGTTAIVGEPLVKYKFALSRLAMIAYNATNASAAATFSTAADSDPIFDRFGLKRTNTSSPWVYNHGSNKILSLAQVATLRREPDFAELLKATIIAGSLAKGGPTLHNNQGNEQYVLDTTTDLQVLQIMANLIDQQDTDSYPTCIQLNAATTLSASVIVSGVEDLPYIYRFHGFTVVDKLPSPLLSKSTSTVTFPAIPAGTTVLGSTPNSTTYPSGAQQTGNWTIANNTSVNVSGCAPGSLTSPGDVTYMYIPAVWNPHDSNTTLNETPSLRPTKFRMYAVTEDPLGLTNPWEMALENQLTNNSVNISTILPETDPNNSANYFWPTSGGASAPQMYPIPTGGQGGTSPVNTTLTFSDNGGSLFREPTLLWNTNPTGINLSGANVTDANTGRTYFGMIVAQGPISTQFSVTSTPGRPGVDGPYVIQGPTSSGALWNLNYLPGAAGTSFGQLTFFLQYQDANNNWITYDAKYPDMHSQGPGTAVVNIADDPKGTYESPLSNPAVGPNNQIPFNDVVMDPRSARFGVGITSQLGNVPGGANIAYTLEPLANSTFFDSSTAGMKKMGNSLFTVVETDRPRVDPGDSIFYSNPCMTTDPGQNFQMRWFGGPEYRSGSATVTSPIDFNGLFSQNNPSIQSTILSQNGAALQHVYYEDADGVARRATGAYADTTLSGSTIGQPLATANTFNNNAVGTPTSQSQSRPMILNRPFRSVAEMSYAFSGTPWKNIDFFTPESGDSALLDTFCINDPPANNLVAGRVDLNTRNVGVIQALVAGSYVDEMNNLANPPADALPPLTSAEAGKVATALVNITADSTHAWRGPLQNIAGLVGRYVSSPGALSGTDYYTYTPPSPVSGQVTSATYAGLSAALDNTVYTNTSTPLIQRFREAAIRPLAATGQVRVWNLLLDVVAQTGHYPPTATSLDQFQVDGQRRLWIHVAIDRLTGQVLDKQVEVVAQ